MKLLPFFHHTKSSTSFLPPPAAFASQNQPPHQPQNNSAALLTNFPFPPSKTALPPGTPATRDPRRFRSRSGTPRPQNGLAAAAPKLRTCKGVVASELAALAGLRPPPPPPPPLPGCAVATPALAAGVRRDARWKILGIFGETLRFSLKALLFERCS